MQERFPAKRPGPVSFHETSWRKLPYHARAGVAGSVRRGSPCLAGRLVFFGRPDDGAVQYGGIERMIDPVHPVRMQPEHEFDPDIAGSGYRSDRDDDDRFRHGRDIPVKRRRVVCALAKSQHAQIGRRLVVDFIVEQQAVLVELRPYALEAVGYGHVRRCNRIFSGYPAAGRGTRCRCNSCEDRIPDKHRDCPIPEC